MNKKTFKVLSLIMSLVVVLASIPIFGILSASAEDAVTWDFYTLRNYTGEKAPHISDTSIIGWGSEATLASREFVSKYTPDGTDWSLKLTSPVNETKNIYLKNLFNEQYGYTDNNCAGIRMWIANPSDRVVNLEWQYIAENSRVGELMSNRTYYLQSAGSDKVYGIQTSTYLRNNGNNQGVYALDIPAGYEGWLYVPFAMLNYGQSATNPFKQLRLYILSETDREVSIYTSRIEYFSNTAVTLATTYDYDFDTVVPYSDTVDIDTNLVNPRADSTAVLDSTIHDGESGQSVKVTYANTSSGATNMLLSKFCTDFASDNADGITFWVKNSHNVDVTLTIMVSEYKNINKNAPYYLKPDGGEAYTAYTGSSPFDDGSRATITLPANFAGKVYIPYSDSQTYNNLPTLKQGLLCLTAYLTEDLPTVTMNFDSFGNYNFEEIGTLTTTTFDNLTSLNDVMWNYSEYSELSTANTDGNSGKCVKATVSSTENVSHRFKNLAPGTDITTYSGREGYRFWISNPNDFAVTAMTQFFEYQRSLVGREYYLIYENGVGISNLFKALHPEAGTTAGYDELGCITIPANFRGYVYIPASSIYDSSNEKNAVTVINGWTFIMTFFPTEKDSSVYIDSYGMYTEEPTINRRGLPTVFSDGVLFQQNKAINVYGFDLPGFEVTAILYKGEAVVETQKATTNSDGRFDISFTALKGGYDTYRMEFSDSNGVFATVNDILIGELWLSGGQSNMEFVIGQADSCEDILNNANSEYLRFFLEPVRPYADGTEQPLYPCDDIENAFWEKGNTSDTTLKNKMSAVAAVFAYNLQKELDVPVGVINTAVGGTKIHQWLGRDAVENNEEMLQLYKDSGMYFSTEETQTNINYTWTALYNAKIAPLAGLNIAGTIWYQGESNSNHYSRYAKELDLLKESWGKIFGFENDSMPFIYTQVAPDCYDNGENDYFQLGYLAEAMNDAFKMNENNNTAMITLYDVSLAFGNEGSIHPNVKIPVGERFANSAMSLCYGETNEASAPVFDSIEVKGNTIYVKFTHIGEGLSCTGTDIHGFNIAGDDGVYVNAKAKIISKDTVMVWNDNLKAPKNVTYAFANMNQAANLVNSVEIPATPFRSDRNAATYLTIEEWMFADADAWEAVDGNLSGFKPSWEVSEGATYSYSTEVKTEGKASLAVTYGDATEVTVSPVINTYEGKEFNLANYNGIKFDIMANAGATVSLVVDGTAYGDAVALENDGFNTVIFALGDDIAAKAAVSFTVSGLTSDVLYIDNIAVGMTDTAVVYGDVNDDCELDSLDLTVIRKHLLDIETEINLDKADVNCDTKIDICDLVRAAKNASK